VVLAPKIDGALMTDIDTDRRAPGGLGKAKPARTMDLGVRDYREILRLQQDLVAARHAGEIVDTLLLVEHPDVITLGRSAKPSNLIDPGAIPVVAIERGGDVTYHGPGQLVAYPILLLDEDERDLHRYLRNLEEAIIRTVADFGILAARCQGKTGVWTVRAEARKLASIGVAVRRWVTFHGLALNVSTALARFAGIHPCGFDAAVMTSMQRELERPVELARVKARLCWHLGAVLGRNWQESTLPGNWGTIVDADHG
jgi:lipoyl(octanoyl) transferase